MEQDLDLNCPVSQTIDWHDTWRKSEEYKAVHVELGIMKSTLGGGKRKELDSEGKDGVEHAEFAMPLVRRDFIVWDFRPDWCHPLVHPTLLLPRARLGSGETFLLLGPHGIC